MRGDQPGLELDRVAAEIYSDVRLAPFLRRLLARSGDLLGTVAGSISLVDPPTERYTKMAERGASCRLGQTFPLDEGVTGQVVARRRPVVLSSYQQISAGHLPAGHPAGSGAVVAVPIWWRGDVIGVNVSFAGRTRHFTAREVDGLEMLTQLAAPGIVQAGASDPSLANMIREYRQRENDAGGADGERGLRTVVTEVGRARPVTPSVAGVALDLVTLAERAAARREPTARLHVAVVHGADRLRLLVYDAADSPGDPILQLTQQPAVGERGWQGLVDSAGCGVSVEHVAGWGTLVRADLPYAQAPQRPTVGSARSGSARGGSEKHADPAASPFTPREQQVAGLLADGLSDRSVAKALVISPKTVEKHVGALLRKTGTTSRTAAVMRALDRGWLPSGSRPVGDFPHSAPGSGVLD
ncbi:MAG TPA: LuxR C-terminal-related transcriptional regulator [Nakamurella sp.]|nr:LuxR C-terminal-related transcriptional regulator [Nakamurella sp.]